MKRAVPWAMVIVRALLGPVMVLGARAGWSGWTLAGIVLFCLVDDILDGMIARRWGTDTAALRLADSTADTVFYLGVVWALWMLFPALLRTNGWWLAVMFGLEAVRYLLDFGKFGKAASYHSYLAKTWGLVIAAAMVAAFGFHGAAWLVRAAIVLGIVVNLEGLTMSLMLPRWQNDVKTLAVAARMRQAMLADELR